MSLATIGSVVGIAAGANSLFGHHGGGGGGGGSPPTAYQPTGQGAADQAWQDFFKQLQSSFTGAQGKIQPAMDQSLAMMLGMTPELMQMYGGLAGQAGQGSGMLQNQALMNMLSQGNLMGAGNQLWNTALDPQKQLYDRTLQQVQQQSRGADTARGIAMSPQSAGLEQQATSNFNIDWQNQQLARQLQGLQGMTGAYQQAGVQGQDVGANLTGALGMAGMAPGFLQAAASWPMQAANMYGQGMASNIYGPMGGIMGQVIPYLYQGLGASNQGFGQYQTGLNNFTTGLNQLGNSSIWNSLGNLFRGGGGGGGSNPAGNESSWFNSGAGWDPGGSGGTAP